MATANVYINYDKIDVSKLVVRDLKRNTKGQGESGFVNSDQFPKTKIAFCIPEITTAFALKETIIEKEVNGVKVKEAAGNYKLTIQLEEGSPLFKWLTDLQEHWMAYVKANEKKQWKKLGLVFDPIIKRSINKQTGEENPPSFSLKVKYDQTSRTFSSIFVDAESGQIINLTPENSAHEIPRGTFGNVMATIVKFWVSASKCGITMQIENAAVIRPESSGDIPMAPMPVLQKPSKGKAKVLQANDEEEDMNDDDEGDDEPVIVRGSSKSVQEFVLEKDEVEGGDDNDEVDELETKKPEPVPTKSKATKSGGKTKSK